MLPLEDAALVQEDGAPFLMVGEVGMVRQLSVSSPVRKYVRSALVAKSCQVQLKVAVMHCNGLQMVQ